MSSLVIARLTFREASRRWILWAALLLGLLFLTVYFFGFRAILRDLEANARGVTAITRSEIYNFMVMAALYSVSFLTIIMTVLTSVDTLSGEINTGTVHTLVSKPVRRWEIVLGKWLGFMGMLTPYLLLMAGGVIAIVYALTQYTPPNMLRGLLLMWLNIAILLSISMAGGSVLSTLANGVLVFGMYGVAFIGGWIEQFGSLMRNPTAVNIGIVCSLILPTEAIWKRAASEMQSPILSSLGGFSFFTGGSVPSMAMVYYGAVYALAAVLIAIRAFSKRDL